MKSIARRAGASGSASTLYPRVVHEEIDAKPKNARATWASVIVSTTGNVYISSLTNDAPATSSPVNSSPSPAVAWAASGADFVGLNGHNHTNIFSAQFNSAPGMFNLTETVQGGSNDAIYDIYDVVGGSPNLDVDSGGQAGYQSTFVSSLPVCSSCLTPTHQNDFIISNFGQLLCTATSLTLPSSGWIDDGTTSGKISTDLLRSARTTDLRTDGILRALARSRCPMGEHVAVANSRRTGQVVSLRINQYRKGHHQPRQQDSPPSSTEVVFFSPAKSSSIFGKRPWVLKKSVIGMSFRLP
jgi:hypothetical protein